VAQTACERRGLPNCKHYVSQFSKFYDGAKQVRSDRRERKIGLLKQHEILATSWNTLIGHGVVEKIVEEFVEKDDGNGKKDEEQGVANHEKKDDNENETRDEAESEDDDEGDGLERWFSWPGKGERWEHAE
jgi:hypothetical protein